MFSSNACPRTGTRGIIFSRNEANLWKVSSLERQYGLEKLRRRLKLAWGVAKMPYYIEECLLKSLLCDFCSALGPYCTNCIGAKWSVFSDTVTCDTKRIVTMLSDKHCIMMISTYLKTSRFRVWYLSTTHWNELPTEGVLKLWKISQQGTSCTNCHNYYTL